MAEETIPQWMSEVQGIKRVVDKLDIVPTDAPRESTGFLTRLKELGFNTEDLKAMLEAGDKKTLAQYDKLLEDYKSGNVIDPIYFPRDEGGRFTGRNPFTWRKGMKSPNPAVKARPKMSLWARTCQIMEMTREEVGLLQTWDGLTLADRAAIQLAAKISEEGSWPQQLESINREEGKVQEKVQIDVPPQPIRFIPVPPRKQLEELEASPALAEDGGNGGGDSDAADPVDVSPVDDHEDVAPEEEPKKSSAELEAAENDTLWR